MFEIGDDGIFTKFEEVKMQDPPPRKEDADGWSVHVSRELHIPKERGAPVLYGFESHVQ